MANTVSENGGIIFLVMEGDQSYDDVTTMGDDLARYTKQGTINKLLLDQSKLGTVDIGSRRAAAKLAKRFQYNQVALVGASLFYGILVQLIARNSQRVKRIKLFSNTNEALEWLKNGAD